MKDNNFGPSVNSLCERGYYFLKEQEFKVATLYFNRALDIDPKTAECYWGLLLAKYQCKDSTELYSRLAVPINNDTYFKMATEYATEAQHKEWKNVSDLTLLSCHKKVVKNLLNGNEFLADKWMKRYSSAVADNDVFKEMNDFLMNAINNTGITPNTLLRLYAKYTVLETADNKSIIGNIKSMVAEQYSSQMKEILTNIKTNPAGFSTKTIDSWANPTSGEFNVDISLDGHGSCVGERYVFLAEEIFNSKTHDYEKYNNVNYCFQKAYELDSKKEYLTKQESLFDKAVLHSDATASEIDHIISIFPDVAKYYWQYIIVYTDNFMKKPKFYEGEHEYIYFTGQTIRGYGLEEAKKLLDTQKLNLSLAKEEYQKINSNLKPYFEKAVEYSFGDERDKYKKAFENYIGSLSAENQNNINEIESRISYISQKIEQYNKIETEAIKTKGMLFSILSVIALALSIPAYMLVKQTFSPTIDYLIMPILASYAIALAVIVIISFIQIKCTSSLLKSVNKKSEYKTPKVYKGIINTARILSMLALPVSVAALVYSYVVFPQNMGTIEIKSVGDLIYVKYAPSCNFSLENDLYCSGITADVIGKFSGEFSGNGYTIHDLTLANENGNGFIKTNKGIISDLCFVSPKFQGEFKIVKNNKGTLENICISDVVLHNDSDFYGMSEKNSGSIIGCEVKNISGECAEFQGICGANDGKIISSHAKEINLESKGASGVVDINRGKVIGCSFSGNIECVGDAYGFSRFSGMGATIERCFTEGTLKGGQNVSGFVGSIDYGMIENCYSIMDLTQVCCEYKDIIGGLIASGELEGKEIIIRNCYFGGKITLVASNMKGYEGVSGLCAYVQDFQSKGGRFLAKSCFYSNTYETSGSKGGYLSGAKKPSLENTYILEEQPELLSVKFITEKLKWSTDIWNVEDGKFPTLKEYTEK